MLGSHLDSSLVCFVRHVCSFKGCLGSLGHCKLCVLTTNNFLRWQFEHCMPWRLVSALTSYSQEQPVPRGHM